jgi:nitrogen regulatory protein PII
MKLLIAFIRPEQFAAVQDAMKGLDLELMTVSEVLDYQEAGANEIYRGRAIWRPASKVRLEIAGNDESIAAATEALGRAGDSGRVKAIVIGLDDRPDPFTHLKRHSGYRSLSPAMS